jgi:DNA-directed RNA polymerase specialized sigma24 family protein
MNSSFLPLSSPMRLALMKADPVSGAVDTIHSRVRESLVERQLVTWSPHTGAHLTELGFRTRAKLLRERKVFSVNGLPFEKIEEITQYYLSGKSLPEISRRTRVPADDVEAALRYRKVLVTA